MRNSSSRSYTGDWDIYWRGARGAGGCSEGGPQDVALTQFWCRLLEREFAARARSRLLDVACGDGAVTRFGVESARRAGATDVSFYCLDSSLAAIGELRKQLPAVTGVRADALRPPFDRQAFDIVASQFGLEYAGNDSFEAAAKLVAPSGMLAVIAHLKDGAIFRECSEIRSALRAVDDYRLVDLAERAFKAGFALLAGKVREADFQQADKDLAPAVERTKALLDNRGRNVAGGMVLDVYRDLAHMYGRMQAYAPDDVFVWLDRVRGELSAYRGRMSAMLEAALDDKAVGQLQAVAGSAGLTVERCETLAMGEKNESAAWELIFRRL